MKRRTMPVPVRSDYELASPDLLQYPPDSQMPDVSTVGMVGYPADFAGMMPGYTGHGMNIAGQASYVPTAEFGAGSGGWSTPQAYSWHSSNLLTTDPEVGGYAGETVGVPFAFGAVESNTVENFELLGAQAVFQNPDVANYGDVGFSDFAGRLSSAVASGIYEPPAYEDVALNILNGV